MRRFCRSVVGALPWVSRRARVCVRATAVSVIAAVQAAALLLIPMQESAADVGCRDEVPGAMLSGAGEFRLLGFHLYDAQLWSARLPVTYDARFALELTYARAVTRERLASLGIAEMKRLAGAPVSEAQVTRWRGDMLRAFVDIAPGDQLCGVYLPGAGVRFFANGTPTATIDDPDFARRFFGIWLDSATRAQGLRDKLLGGK